ncbi:MAG: putative serine/threonine-protein phosphatase 2A 56 kDa regulatory subunit alpha [Streblomastix strix]|uniref:Putative serine/threonine-protein phosphatase 2A 56 kDa regulatory subunit alpha n=1 Tax=Streblomastix strix TaxID=222440 RepID=A0A5J4X5B8_9EUKA|nr:MAG: putative serine/threonine-protein phosphatase 2A 56 kDa regulatory subunit alpha [Streblomastix strix]
MNVIHWLPLLDLISETSADFNEEDPTIEESQLHIEKIQDIFQLFEMSPDVELKIIKLDAVDKGFIVQLVNLLDTEDPRERETLKAVMHKMYVRFAAYRMLIHNSKDSIFDRVGFNKIRFNGTAELLKIMGSVFAGLTFQIKVDLLRLFRYALLLLHHAIPLPKFNIQLLQSIQLLQQNEKRSSLDMTWNLLHTSPKILSHKEVIYMVELEGITDCVRVDQLLA